MFSLEMYARTQYTHNPLHSGVQPALCVLVPAGWIQAFRGLGHIAGLQREVSQDRAVRGGCARHTEGLMPQLESLSPAPGEFAHFSDSRSDSLFLCMRATWLGCDICFRHML